MCKSMAVIEIKELQCFFCVSQRMGQGQNWRSCYCQIEEQELCGYYKVLQRTTPYYKVLLQYYSVLPVLPCTTHYYHASHWYPFCCRHPSAIKVRYWDSKTFKGYDSWMGDWLPRAIFWILGYRSGIVRGIVRILPKFLENIHYFDETTIEYV